MKFCLITDIISPHQMPLAQEVVNLLGAEQFRYIATSGPQLDRVALGWGAELSPEWVLRPGCRPEDQRESERWAETADVVLCAYRDIVLFEKRSAAGKQTFYMSERWFKPPYGMFRLCRPDFLKMAVRICRLFCSSHFYYLPIGFHAACDMHRLMRVFSMLTFRPTPSPLNLKCLLWGYFVGESDSVKKPSSHDKDRLRVLWFGRFLNWKRIDVVIQAFRQVLTWPGPHLSLRIVGCGVEEDALRQQVKRAGLCGHIQFEPPKPIAEIRAEIRSSDVCVISSNAQEGWGVAVNEALIEGCCTIASDAAGAGATLIRNEVNGLLFKSGSSGDLARQLQRVRMDPQLREQLGAQGQRMMLNEWAPKVAAERLIALSENLLAGREPPQWSSGPLSVVLSATSSSQD